MKGFGDAKIGKDKSPRMSDLVDIYPWPKGDYESVRIVGPVYSVNQIWFTIITKAGKKTSFPKMCLDHDGKVDDYVTDICPYRESGKGRSSKTYYVNVIPRDIQATRKSWPGTDKKIKHLGYEMNLAKKGDVKKTPVRVLEIPSSVAEKIQQLQKLNFVKKKDGSKKTYEASDVKYGFDLNILYDESKEGARKYDVQKGDRTPLSEEEIEYAMYKLDLLKPDPLDRAKSEMRDLMTKIVEDDDKKGKKGKKGRDDEDEDEDDRPKKKRGRDIDDDDMTTLDADDLEDDEDEDDRPKKKGKNKKRDADDEDEDEDDRPKKKSKKRRDDDEDEDDDLDDEDEDEDDEPPKKKGKNKKRSRDEEEDDEDLDDEDEDGEEEEEDEDDEPPRKKKKKSRR